MHDIVDLEGRGLAGVLVATVEFTDAAEHQARALGADPAAVYVRHPIQDRTDSEMIAIADEAFARLLTQLVNETPNGRSARCSGERMRTALDRAHRTGSRVDRAAAPAGRSSLLSAPYGRRDGYVAVHGSRRVDAAPAARRR